MFHYLFPPLTIGLGALMVIMEALFLRTRNPVYEQMARFWTGIFAVNFAMGVATGIVMEFEFGTNWAGYSKFVGDIFGSVLAAEGIFAFFSNRDSCRYWSSVGTVFLQKFILSQPCLLRSVRYSAPSG